MQATLRSDLPTASKEMLVSTRRSYPTLRIELESDDDDTNDDQCLTRMSSREVSLNPASPICLTTNSTPSARRRARCTRPIMPCPSFSKSS